MRHFFNQTSKEINQKKGTALIFGMAVALMRYNVELWWNGGGIVATAQTAKLFFAFFLPN